MTQKDQIADSVGRGRIYNSITETIGNTPIVSLSRMAAEHGLEANCSPSSNFSIRLPASKTALALP